MRRAAPVVWIVALALEIVLKTTVLLRLAGRGCTPAWRWAGTSVLLLRAAE